MHRLTIVNRVVLVGIAAGLMSGALAPAQAARVQAKDATGDVWSPEGAGGFTDEGYVANTDLKRTVLRHGVQAVTIRAGYKNLTKKSSDEIQFSAYLRTSESRRFGIVAWVDPDGEGTSYRLWRGVNQVPLDCEGIDGHTSFADDNLKIRLPRSCLGKPRWVRYQALAESYKEETGLFRDPALGSGPRLKTWSERIRRD